MNPLRALVVLVVCIACVQGCCEKSLRILAPEGPAPTAEQFAQAQSKRLDALSSLALRGHAELRWRDASGGHFDDGDFDLLVRPPREMSLRLSKLGEKILWVGAGDGQWWIVFPRDRPSRAILQPWTADGSPRARQSAVDEKGLSQLLVPTRLLEALGLSGVRALDVRSVSWDEMRAAWVFTLADRRVFARGESLLPIGCEWLDATGAVVASCTLDGFEWVRGERALPAGSHSSQQLVATRIEFSVWSNGRTSADGQSDATCALAAEVPSYGVDRLKPQLFNWPDVAAALRPELVETGR